jgi:hypothetical protein
MEGIVPPNHNPTQKRRSLVRLAGIFGIAARLQVGVRPILSEPKAPQTKLHYWIEDVTSADANKVRSWVCLPASDVPRTRSESTAPAIARKDGDFTRCCPLQRQGHSFLLCWF